MKPYRLINAKERNDLLVLFRERLKPWCDTYCYLPITLELNPVSKTHVDSEQLSILNNQDNLLALEKNYISFLNLALFGRNSISFNSTSESLFLTLVNTLFGIETSILTRTKAPLADWIYAGSTCLLIQLECQGEMLNLYVNPHWVYQQLPSLQSGKSTLTPLHEALHQETLTLHLELKPLTLPIKQLLHLQIGDVLSSDHYFSEPLNLMHQNHCVAQADLGQSNHYKSIILKRTS